jgi:alkanesulfonate monooxygenase SsuD/methylene tetrahydromethanopterin reductase-like flavin-dependent oxidoreductase (luciferase family)
MTRAQAEFGVFLPPERIANVIPAQGFQFFEKTVQTCERPGYNAVFSADHWMEVVSSVMYECWTLLGALAAVTSKIRLGSAVTPIPLYHPPSPAKRVATVDHISRGRTTFGAGCG